MLYAEVVRLAMHVPSYTGLGEQAGLSYEEWWNTRFLKQLKENGLVLAHYRQPLFPSSKYPHEGNDSSPMIAPYSAGWADPIGRWWPADALMVWQDDDYYTEFRVKEFVKKQEFHPLAVLSVVKDAFPEASELSTKSCVTEGISTAGFLLVVLSRLEAAKRCGQELKAIGYLTDEAKVFLMEKGYTVESCADTLPSNSLFMVSV